MAEKVERCIPEQVHHLLSLSNSCIAGGFVRDAIVGDPYRDIDIFNLSLESARYTAVQMVRKYGVEIREDKHKIEFEIDVLAPNTDGTMIMFEPRTVQLIHGYQVEDFDMYCCMNTFSYRGGLVAFPATKDRIIGMRQASAGTLSRLYNLLRRGWHCDIVEIANAAYAWANADQNTKLEESLRS